MPGLLHGMMLRLHGMMLREWSVFLVNILTGKELWLEDCRCFHVDPEET